MIFYILYIKQKSSLLCMLVIGRLWCLVKNDCTYFSVDFYFISKARKFTQNLHRNWKNKDIHFDVLRWSRNFFTRETVSEGVKGLWGLFGNFAMKVFISFGGNRACRVILFDPDMDVIVG